MYTRAEISFLFGMMGVPLLSTVTKQLEYGAIPELATILTCQPIVSVTTAIRAFDLQSFCLFCPHIIQVLFNSVLFSTSCCKASSPRRHEDRKEFFCYRCASLVLAA